MNDPQIHLDRGALPWKPASGSVLLQTYDRYDMPLMGIISQSGEEYFFRCIGGEVEAFSLWKYAHATGQPRELLDALDGETFVQTASNILTGEGTVAISMRGFGIVAWLFNDDPRQVMTSAQSEALWDELQAFLSDLQASGKQQRIICSA